MTYFLLAFLAGILTVLTPCVLPLLPVILGGSIATSDKARPYIVTGSLVVSITLFSILLKASTALIMVDPFVWKALSGCILILLGLAYVFPDLWTGISIRLGFSRKSEEALTHAGEKGTRLGAVFTGAALGPVFASCSPTYAIIIATILPVSFVQGVGAILVYALGLAVIMLLVALLGRKLIAHLRFLADPHGWFRKILGILFILIGIAIMVGWDKYIEKSILDAGFFDATRIEQHLLKQVEQPTTLPSTPNANPMTTIPELNIEGTIYAPEITGITEWINSSGETLAALKGKVVMIDFWTYSCINCQRTLPYVTKWYDTYKDQGFVVIGVHAPEFSFEKVKANVEKAVTDFGIRYPVGLDNDFATWRAFSNRYWPAHYLIDREGRIRRAHFGEGEYTEMEKAIRFLLSQDSTPLPEMVSQSVVAGKGTGKYCAPDGQCFIQTPETYLGHDRSQHQKNTPIAQDQVATYTASPELATGEWDLIGEWMVNHEKIESRGAGKLRLRFNAQDVFLVVGSNDGKEKDLTIRVNGELKNLGKSVGVDGVMKVGDYKLYHLVHAEEFVHDALLEISVPSGISMNAFTFG